MQPFRSFLKILLSTSLTLTLVACASSAAPTANNQPADTTLPVPTAAMPVTGATAAMPTANPSSMTATQTAGRSDESSTRTPGAPTPTPVDLSQYPNGQLLATPTWLAAHLNDPSVRIIDMRSSQAYQQGHIPGAVNIPVGDIVTTVNNVPFMFSQNGVQQALDRSGLTPDMTAVIYDDLGMLNSARMFWTLEYVGHQDARILDGGWNAWNADNGQVSTQVPQYQASQYPIQLVPSKLISEQELLQHLNDPNYIIVDARSPQEYDGSVKESARGGHIPGAINLTWLNDLTGEHLVYTTQSNWQAVLQEPEVEVYKPAKQLQSILDQLGIQKGKTVVTYCQTFWRGAQVYFLMRLMGYQNVRGYDGSWAQWGNDFTVPVTQGSRP